MKPLSQKNIKPLDQDNAAPCHECGSVQCAFCSLRINNALLWAKSWRVLLFSSTCSNCNQHAIVYIKDKEMSILCKDCMLSRAFGEVTR